MNKSIRQYIGHDLGLVTSIKGLIGLTTTFNLNPSLEERDPHIKRT